MNKLLKFKIGCFTAGIYLFLFLIAIIQLNVGRPDALSGLGLLFLTAPWSFIFLDFINTHELIQGENNKLFFYTLITFCALINAAILYLAGYLLSKVMRFYQDKGL